MNIPNVEIAALCDVDQAVVESGCKMVEAPGRKRPATFADIRKVLDDRSIDAVSIATPNFHHTLQTIWALQAGKDVVVEKPVSHNMFEAQQIIAASRKYNRIVQDGTGAQAWLHEAKKRLEEAAEGRRHRGRLHGARSLLQVARHHRAGEGEPVPAGVSYDLWTGPAPVKPFTRNRLWIDCVATLRDLSRSVRLSLTNASFAKCALTLPLNLLPPVFGITLVTRPPACCSALAAPPETTISCVMPELIWY